ncbi:hypothetical protein [Ruminococcus sp. Marseille-P6503]|nr:hypothetical protein [Ruminococcus sp. Marseille-P6503]
MVLCEIATFIEQKKMIISQVTSRMELGGYKVRIMLNMEYE